jgi:hypothetical protein
MYPNGTRYTAFDTIEEVGSIFLESIPLDLTVLEL